MAHSFEVGDIVTGKQDATHRYAITICGTIMNVEEVGRDSIRVRVIDIDEELATGSMKIDGKTNVATRIMMIKQDARAGNMFTVDAAHFESYSYPVTSDELNSFWTICKVVIVCYSRATLLQELRKTNTV